VSPIERAAKKSLRGQAARGAGVIRRPTPRSGEITGRVEPQHRAGGGRHETNVSSIEHTPKKSLRIQAARCAGIISRPTAGAGEITSRIEPQHRAAGGRAVVKRHEIDVSSVRNRASIADAIQATRVGGVISRPAPRAGEITSCVEPQNRATPGRASIIRDEINVSPIEHAALVADGVQTIMAATWRQNSIMNTRPLWIRFDALSRLNL
jgi:hypothetical protein